MTFRGDFPIGLALSDGRGNLSPSLIEGSQVQVTAQVLMLFRLRLNANGVANHVLAWHGGPIRLIRRVSHSVKLIFGIKSPSVLSEEIFTATTRRIVRRASAMGPAPVFRRRARAHVARFHRTERLCAVVVEDGAATIRARGSKRRGGGGNPARSAGGEMARAQGRRQDRDADLHAIPRPGDSSTPALLLRWNRGSGYIPARRLRTTRTRTAWAPRFRSDIQ